MATIERSKHQAIVCKYLAPTDTRGSRIKASCVAGSVTVPYDHGEDPYHAACLTLLAKLGWGGRWVEGGMPDGSGDSVFVCLSREE